MPELPEVETVMRGLVPHVEGRVIAHADVRRPDLRFPFPERFADRLAGRRVLALSRRSKFILAHLSGDETLMVHLGMSGRITVHRPAGQSANLAEFYFQDGSDTAGSGRHDHVVLDLDDGVRIVYCDPRRFGMMDLVATGEIGRHRLVETLGVEPLGNALNAAYLRDRFAGKTANLKAALLDQRIIAGLGNIYVCEVLHRAGLSPDRLAGTLARPRSGDARLDRLVSAIRLVLDEAIRAGGSTLRDYAAPDGAEGGFQQRFSAYGRAGARCPKPDCNGIIRREIQSGRSTFFCPRCQR